MLIQFRVKNFKSFKDDTTLYMEATDSKDFEKHPIKSGGINVLPVATIYGANSSGKSNIIEAFSYMNEFIKDSVKYGEDGVSFVFRRAKPFLFDKETQDKESEFEVIFTVPRDKSGKQYAYGFCVDNNGVTEEWLCVKKKSEDKFKFIFYRSKEDSELDLSGFSKEDEEKIKNALKDESLIVSVGSSLNVDACKLVEKWFFSNMIVFFSNIDTSKELTNSAYCPDNIRSDKDVQEEVATYMNYFGNNVKGFEARRKLTLDGVDLLEVTVLHQKAGSDEIVKVPLKDESNGFRKLFMTYGFVRYVLSTGGTLFVDDLDANVHTLVLRYLYQLFLNRKHNINHAQLVMTSHNTWFLGNPMLRCDEVWFTNKNMNEVSELYSLADFQKVRETDPDYIIQRTEDNYLCGCYGAIPKFYDYDEDNSSIAGHLPKITKRNTITTKEVTQWK